MRYAHTRPERKEEVVLGYCRLGYGALRVGHGLHVERHGLRYRRVRRVPYHRLPLAPPYLDHWNMFLPRPRVHAMHLFNGVCASRRVPWLCSFEMEYPRYFGAVSEEARRAAFERMAADECRALLPMSDAARRHFLNRVPNWCRRRIERKLRIFTGGVSVPDAVATMRRSRRPAPGALDVIFVGRQFWHKGGPAVVDAVQGLRARGADVRLTVVSCLERESHVVETSEPEARATLARLKGLPWIDYHSTLSNDETLRLMARSDVLAFPSLDESLGWVLIEAMAIGLPVITTNVFAIPELVTHRLNGLMIELPLDRDRRWKGIAAIHPPPRPSYREAHQHLVEGCTAGMELFLNDPGRLTAMGQAGRDRFTRRYDAVSAAAKLAMIVREALG